MAAYFEGQNDLAIQKLGEVYCTCDDDLQMKHHAFRFLIDAKARVGQMEQRDQFADTVEEFLTHLPSGPVQDADSLDICGYLLAECGRPERGLEVYEKCIRSPSTSREQLLDLLGRYLNLANMCGKDTRASEVVDGMVKDIVDLLGDTLKLATRNSTSQRATGFIASMVADLVQFGMTSDELGRLCIGPLREKIGSGAIDDVMKRVRRQLEPSTRAMAV
jgi:hypothetical protein